MWIELDGTPDKRGMVIDFKDIKDVIKPLVDAWDHAILVDETDQDLIKAIELLKSKHYALPYDTSSENLCLFVADYLKKNALELLKAHRITSMLIRVQETETCYAEHVEVVD